MRCVEPGFGNPVSPAILRVMARRFVACHPNSFPKLNRNARINVLEGEGIWLRLPQYPASKICGGSFLIEERTPEDVFTPEDFTEQHLLIAQTAEEFANKEIVPNIEKMEHKDFAVTRELVKKAGELGLSGVDVPEAVRRHADG